MTNLGSYRILVSQDSYTTEIKIIALDVHGLPWLESESTANRRDSQRAEHPTHLGTRHLGHEMPVRRQADVNVQLNFGERMAKHGVA